MKKQQVVTKVIHVRPINQSQRKYLKGRVNAAYNRLRCDDKEEVEPVAIRRARRLIETYERHTYAKRSQRTKWVAEAKEEVEKILLFGTVQEALAAVERFERLKHK